MNNSFTPARPGTRTDTALSGRRVDFPDNVSGRIETTLLAMNGDSKDVAVRLEDGRDLVIPLDLLKLREDGSYFVPHRLEALTTPQESTGAPADVVVPVIEEDLVVAKRQVETGRVRVTKRVKTREEVVDQPLFRQEVDVVRVPVNQVVTEPPQARQEGDTMIVPIFEEVLVVEKRLMLKEELHIRQRRVETHHPERVVLRSEEVQVERFTAPGAPEQDKGK